MWKKPNKYAGSTGAPQQSNPYHTSRKSIWVDDVADEDQLETEFSRLQRQLYVMEGDRRAYREEAWNIIRKQQIEISKLRKEGDEIGHALEVIKSEKNQMIDAEDATKLAELSNTLDNYLRQCEDEKRKLAFLDSEILNVQQLIDDERKFIGCMNEENIEISLSQRLRITENRLDQHLIRFNKQLAENKMLRDEIDHLRQDKAVYDDMFKKLTKNLEDTKFEMNKIIQQASQAYEERDEAQTKMMALKERNDKDVAQYEIEMKDLQRIIKHDNKLKDFMGIKANDRADLKEEEQAKKRKDQVSAAVDKDSDLEKHTIAVLEGAFERMKASRDQEDIDVIVDDFIKQEDQIFALYNYVNELNDTVDNLQDEISLMKKEIQRFQDDDVKHEDQRLAMLKEMELKCIKFRDEADKAEAENAKICKVLDELRSGVTQLLKDTYCDLSAITDMLGRKREVTNKNILQYMGIIEQRTMELLQLQQYIEMKKEPQQTERKDSKGQPIPPLTLFEPKTSPKVQVAIVAPSTIDDDVFEDGGDLRPLTRNELKTVVLKMLNGISVPSQPSSKHGRKSKANSIAPLEIKQ